MKFNKEELENILCEEDIYKLLNEIDIDEEEFEDIEIDDLRVKKLKNNLKKELKFKMSKRTKYGLGVASMFLVSVISVGAMGIANPSFAQNIPVLNSIVKMLKDDKGYQGDYEKYSSDINETQYDRGISITLNEAIYDETEILLTYTIKSDKKLEELGEDIGGYENIKINGNIDGFSGGVSSSKQIDEYTMTVLANYSLGMTDLPDKFKMDYDINKIFNVDGNWKFSFNLSKQQLKGETKKINTNIVKNFEGTDVKISSVSFTPISTNIQLSGKKNKDFNDLNSHFGFFEYDYWLLFDDKGNEIARRENSSGGGTNLGFKSGYRYDAVVNIPDYLTVVPLQFRIREEFGSDSNENKSYKRNKEEYMTEDIKKPINDKYPIILEQGRFGRLIITEIEENEDKIIIKYKAEGKLPFFQASQLYLESKDGKQPFQKMTPLNIGYDNEEYILEVKNLSKDKKYYFVTSNLNNYDFKDEYVFKIPVE